jgi:hypothetical protein
VEKSNSAGTDAPAPVHAVRSAPVKHTTTTASTGSHGRRHTVRATVPVTGQPPARNGRGGPKGTTGTDYFNDLDSA